METNENPHTKKIRNVAMKAFFEEALAWIQRETSAGKTAATVEFGTPQWQAWKVYLLERTGALPAAMKMVENSETGTVTMPTEWPHWFDVHSVPGTQPRQTSRPEPGHAERSRVAAGFDRLRRELQGSTMSMRNPHPLPREPIRPERSTDAA